MKNDDQPNFNQDITFYSSTEYTKFLAKKNSTAQLITAVGAATLRDGYNNQNVKFKNAKGDNIMSFIISFKALDDLKKIAANDGRDFMGIALTPGYVGSGSAGAHTFIVTALGSIKKDDVLDSTPAKTDFVHVLPEDSNSANHLYDHLDICPDVCPQNKDRLTAINNPWTSGK